MTRTKQTPRKRDKRNHVKRRTPAGKNPKNRLVRKAANKPGQSSSSFTKINDGKAIRLREINESHGNASTDIPSKKEFPPKESRDAQV